MRRHERIGVPSIRSLAWPRKARIVGALPAEPFPRTLSLEDQGLFAIGYYHQRQRLFQRAETATTDAAAPKET